MGKINEYSKDIRLWNIFKNFLWKMKKIITSFFLFFYIFYKKIINLKRYIYSILRNFLTTSVHWNHKI